MEFFGVLALLGILGGLWFLVEGVIRAALALVGAFGSRRLPRAFRNVDAPV